MRFCEVGSEEMKIQKQKYCHVTAHNVACLFKRFSGTILEAICKFCM